MPQPALIELRNVSKRYPPRGAGVWRRAPAARPAVDDVSFGVVQGQTLSLVGESGCGKSTTLRMLLGIEPPSAGTVMFEGRALPALGPAERRSFRGAVQAVFQDPWASLNPRRRVGWIIAEPLLARGLASRAEASARAVQLLDRVGLRPEHAELYPHEFSGGQRQRIAIARALALRPRLVVLDEPVSALDVSIRAQIINLLLDLQEADGLSYVFVAHQLGTVWSLSDEVAVMYAGRIVEHGASEALRLGARHPYTAALFAAAPPSHPRDAQARPRPSAAASETEMPAEGCLYQPRCPRATAICATRPPLRPVATHHAVACHHA